MTLSFEEIKANALQKATLVEALSYASMMDTERAVRQAIDNHVNGTVSNVDTGAKWETCSAYMFKEIAKAWEDQSAICKDETILATTEYFTLADPLNITGIEKPGFITLAANADFIRAWLVKTGLDKFILSIGNVHLHYGLEFILRKANSVEFQEQFGVDGVGHLRNLLLIAEKEDGVFHVAHCNPTVASEVAKRKYMAYVKNCIKTMVDTLNLNNSAS